MNTKPVHINPGDLIKVRPRDSYFYMLVSPLMMVDRIINALTLVTVDDNIIDLATFEIIYVNGVDVNKYEHEVDNTDSI